MHVARIGFAPLKGARHVEHPAVVLADTGPVGDRAFCLVDPARDRVLRTVENPSLVQATARVDGDRLEVRLGGAAYAGVPEATGDRRKVDYWGRVAEVELLDGPWAAAFSEHLGHEVRLARPLTAGDVVYGGSVTLVTTGSLRLLSQRLGRPVASERFRSTFLLDTEWLDPHVEDTWVGRDLTVGEATVRVRGTVPRCAVVDLDPASGTRDAAVLGTLAGYRRRDGEIFFGVDAVVTAGGRVRTGDPIVMGRD